MQRGCHWSVRYGALLQTEPPLEKQGKKEDSWNTIWRRWCREVKLNPVYNCHATYYSANKRQPSIHINQYFTQTKVLLCSNRLLRCQTVMATVRMCLTQRLVGWVFVGAEQRSYIGRDRHLDGRPPGNTRCCKLFNFSARARHVVNSSSFFQTHIILTDAHKYTFNANMWENSKIQNLFLR